MPSHRVLCLAVLSLSMPAFAHAQLAIDDVARIIRAVHDAEGVDLGSASTREQRTQFWRRAVGVVHWGHPIYNPTPDPRWCVKDAGGGRPMSDDVVVQCASRDAWDLIGGSGAEAYFFHINYVGVLPSNQNVYPPPVPAMSSAAPILAAGVVSGSSLTLNWQAPTVGPMPAGYSVVAATTAAGPLVANVPVGGSTTLAVSALNGRFYIRVLAHVSGGDVASNQIRVDVGPPGPPRELRARVIGNNVTFSWTQPSGPSVTGYVLEAGTEAGLSDLATLTLGRVPNFLTPPLPNGSYFVRVQARNGSGLGPPSNEVRAVVGPWPPDAPTLSASAGAGGVVTIAWLPPVAGAPITGYRLHAGRSPGSSDVAVVDLPAGQTSLVAAGAPPGTYYLHVVANSDAGWGFASNEVTLIVP